VINKFEEMSKNFSTATSVRSVTICPICLFLSNDQNDSHDDINPDNNDWKSFISVYFGCCNKRHMERRRRALSNLSECKKTAFKDLNGPGISDHDYLHGSIPLATFAGGFIVSALRRAMLSSIEMQHFEMRIGDLQAHPRFLALYMLLDLEQIYNNLRRLHISIDSKFNNPVQLQGFPKSIQLQSSSFKHCLPHQFSRCTRKHQNTKVGNVIARCGGMHGC
jgi:hypothetical protein